MRPSGLGLPSSADREPFDEDVLVGPPGAERAQGRLRYSPDQGLTLTVMGADWLAGEQAEQAWPSLQGESFASVPLTLLDAAGRRREFTNRRGRAEISAQTLVVGTHVASRQELRFGRAAFSLRGLREWLSGGWSQIEPNLKDGVNPDVQTLNFTIGESDLLFVSSVQESIARFRTVEERQANVSITVAEPASLAQWQDRWITPLRDLMIFANRERSVLTELSGFVEADTLHGAVRIFERRETTIDPETNFSFYQRDLLPVGIIDPAALVSAWIDLHSRLGASTAFLFGTLNASRLPVENEFLNLMAFAEAYHRVLHNEPPLEAEDHSRYRESMLAALPNDEEVRALYDRDFDFSNRQSQRERMRWFVLRAEMEDWADDLGEDIVGRLVATRNWLTHWGKKTTKVAEGPDLALLNRQLLFVIESNLLSDLGLDDEAVTRCLALGYVWDYPF
jgi:ApeA N-terminal domain 1